MVKAASTVTMEDLLNDQAVDEMKQGEVVTGSAAKRDRI